MPEPSTGQTFGTYIMYEELGKGGMATVHRAEMRERNGRLKQIALKRLLPRAASRKELVASFLHEAKLLQQLEHPNIMRTYESGKVFGHYFIAMEYIPGPTLKELVDQCRITVGSVPEPITLSIAAQMCDALDHAHTKKDAHGRPLGIVHRDISPANIILSDGVVKLIDWGLAKASLADTQTAEGMIKGKFGYLAPEYIGSGKIDARADLWAVGIIMYELLTSRRLFDGHDDFETVARVKNLPIPRPSLANPRVTPELDVIVMKALERNPTYRWKSAADMRDALHAVLAQPGNAVDGQQIADWVKWLFSQTPGSEASGVAQLREIVAAPAGDVAPPVPASEVSAAPELEPAPSGLRNRVNVVWIGIAVALALLLFWKLAA